MPGSRRSLGPIVAPRPFVEKIRQPLYDSVLMVTGSQSNRFFVNPIGAVNASAINGATNTEIDTNMENGGSLPTPKSFSIEAISIKYDNLITLADLTALNTTTHVRLSVGEKVYLQCPVYAVPGDVGLEGNMIRTGGADLALEVLSIHNGIGMHKNVYDILIPEEIVNPVTGRGAWTGRKVPIHLPSNQQFSVTLIHPGGITLGASVRAYVYLWGELKREVH